jgi:TRAP-type uncharacterized transport system substrate-binding protein
MRQVKAQAKIQAKKAVNAAKFSLVQFAELMKLVLPAAAVIAIAFFIALQFVEPAPPKAFSMATGAETGAYFGFGQKYAAQLNKARIKVDVRKTAGSIENLRLLRDPKSGVSVALVQGGLMEAADRERFISIGRVFLEPIWVFHRLPETPERLTQLSGKRVAVGPEGGGTRPLALALFEANALTAAQMTYSPLGGLPAVEALERGEIDAVVLAVAPESPLVKRLMMNPSVKLMSFGQADAYSKRFSYLTKVTLPRGAMDLVADLPAADVHLLAPQAALIARQDLHPALATLLAEAAQEIHGAAGLFHSARQFPTPVDPELDTSPDAERFYKQGQSLLKRVLPFWLATFVERMVVMIVPIATVAIPLFKLVPALYRWQIKRRLLAWYERLREVEARVAVAQDDASRKTLAGELAEVDRAVSILPVPVAYAEQLYNLKSHIELVRQRLAAA